MESNIVNIKNLPKTEEVLPGDLLLIEKKAGSSILDFRDFVIGPSNTSFYNALVTNIKSVSTYALNISASLTDFTERTLEEVQTQFTILTARWNEINPLWFEFRESILMEAQAFKAYSEFTTTIPNITINDIDIKQVNLDISGRAKILPIIFEVVSEKLNNIAGPAIYTYTMGVTTLSAPNQTVLFTYRVLKPYYKI
jgi:hypothetical protein